MDQASFPLFFILGRERSGTTLLQGMLSAHSRIHIPQESPFIRHLIRKYGQRLNWDERLIDQFLNDLYTEPYFRYWNVERESLKKILAEQPKLDFNKAVWIIISLSAPEGTTWLGDKNPQYGTIAPALLRQFPKAKFIWLVRDYRAQVNSMLKVQLEAHNVTALAYRWRDYNEGIRRFQQLHGDQVYLLRYEDLVADPKKSLSGICQFLGLEYEANMTVDRLKGISENTFYHDIHHTSLKSDLDTEKSEAWCHELGTLDQAITERVCGSLGEKLGYERHHPPIGWSPRFFSGWLYGRSYFPFVSLLYRLPIFLRNLIYRKVIYPRFKFWREMSEVHEQDPPN